MFALFFEDNFKDFWENKPGDEFIIPTCACLNMDIQSVDLVYFMSLNKVPEHYDFDINKKLVIKNKIVTPVEKIFTDEQGIEHPYTEDVVTYEVIKTLDPEFFMAKGIMVKPC